MPRHLLVTLLFLLIPSLIPVSARAKSDEEREQQQEEQSIEGKNPLAPQRVQVAFSGSGSATFTPRNLAGATPAPNCTPAVTQVGFNVQCLSDPETKSASTCRGSLSLYGFNQTSNVVGEVTALGDSYSMKLSSADESIQGCELSNVVPVSASLGNVITMPGCGLNLNGCAGELVGSGADHALTSSGSVILTPSD